MRKGKRKKAFQNLKMKLKKKLGVAAQLGVWLCTAANKQQNGPEKLY
jgi:hypothetical protein